MFVVLLQCLVRQLAAWMRAVDEEEDVQLAAQKAEAAEASCFGRCLRSQDISKACFLAHR